MAHPTVSVSWPLINTHAADLLDILSLVDEHEAKERALVVASRKRERAKAASPQSAPVKRRCKASPARSLASTSAASDMRKGDDMVSLVSGGTVVGHLVLDHKGEVYGHYISEYDLTLPGNPPASWRTLVQWYDCSKYSIQTPADDPRLSYRRSVQHRANQVSLLPLNLPSCLTLPPSDPPCFVSPMCVSYETPRGTLLESS
jgi:hypothetical protein